MTLRIEQNGAVVVEKWNDGANWFRVWSDGWIEQCVNAFVAGDGTVTISLLKPFSNTDYSVSLSGRTDRIVMGGSGMVTFERKSESSVVVFNGADGGIIANVIACGY